MNNQSDFSKGKILPMILRFSIPAASLLITAIYNIVDRIFIGNFNGNTALAALSIYFPLSFMMIAFGLMCSAGGSTLFTLYRGKEDTNNANKSFSSAFLLTIFFEVLLTICLLLFPSNFLKLFGVTETTYSLALLYHRPCTRFCHAGYHLLSVHWKAKSIEYYYTDPSGAGTRSFYLHPPVLLRNAGNFLCAADQ
ncbi:MATE family efflux transporter [Sinanaerobacter sp. ZZT-01]|nr:MATE family efflux transporter [Sinanaerobacter sp. ZZT-01]WRR92374.1 MATE family efflux transporter [Sinanaerobacter sp. ZZT-01]